MENETPLTEVNQDSLAVIIKSEIDVQIATAKAYPRSIKQFLDKAMSIATVSEDVAASCTYALPRSGKNLEGPSVRLAEIVCSSYGNIRSGARIIANDGKTITAQGVCHDLEANNFISVEVRRKITNSKGEKYSEDMQVVTGNAACAIAFRNAVFKVIPAALVSEVYNQAKLVARGTAETLVKRRDAAVHNFKNRGIKDEQICEALGIKKIEDIDLDNLATLRGMLTALNNSETTLTDLFPKEKDSKEEAAKKKESERVLKMINAATTPGELDLLKDDAEALGQLPAWNQKHLELSKQQ